ncbi:hypothetical protein [Blastococcus saxobsidens]|uniref:hypothetical protein n=1 Tax=Blastococcus saxobsidens TaxID=138336 RepID=UPI00131539FD|nr:hypothetical protein [Blastococcus saxobsidens]
MAPLTHADVQKLAEKFRLQDEEYTRQLRERDDLAQVEGIVAVLADVRRRAVVVESTVA